jgi:hypothetical protein
LNNNLSKRLSFDSRQLASYTFWSTLDSVALRASDAFIQVLLVVLLVRSDYGLFGLALGYLQLVALLSFQPESALLRYLPKANTESGRRKLLAQCYSVTIHKTWLLSFRYLAIAAILWVTFDWQLAVITLLLGLLTELRMLQYAFAMLLKLADKNGKAVVLNFGFRIFQLSCLGLALFWSQSIWSYLLAMTICQLLATLTLYIVTCRDIRLRLLPRLKDAIAYWPVLARFVGWAHVSNFITSLIFALHVIFLSWAGADLDAVGTFSVGVRIAAFCFVVPMAIQGAATLAISGVEETVDRVRRLGAYVRLLSLFSLLQFISFVVLGPLLLEALFRLRGAPLAADQALEIYRISLPMVLGATLLNCFRPFIAYAVATEPMWRYTILICLPSTVITLISYAVTAQTGPVFVSYAALVCYPLLGMIAAVVAVGPSHAVKSLLQFTATEKIFFADLRNRFTFAR